MVDDWSDQKSNFLLQKADFVREETLLIHKMAQGTRIGSSLSCIEILVALYYGKILRINPENLCWEKRDRFIVSKGHGSISLYPILADLGFFPKEELKKVATRGSILGAIPDCVIPGYETTNGSLGHGLGVACGMAIALRRRQADEKILVLVGDGELYEGAVWEAIMFAGEHLLGNITMIIDSNKACMLDFCKNIIDLEPYEDKFKAFKWDPHRVDGHNLKDVYQLLHQLKNSGHRRPQVVIADTVKGKGVPDLEKDSLSHIKSVQPDQIDGIIQSWKNKEK